MEKSNFTLPEVKVVDPVELRNFKLKRIDYKINTHTTALTNWKSKEKVRCGWFRSEWVVNVNDFGSVIIIASARGIINTLKEEQVSLFEFFSYKECFVEHLLNTYDVGKDETELSLDELKEKKVPRYDRIKLNLILDVYFHWSQWGNFS